MRWIKFFYQKNYTYKTLKFHLWFVSRECSSTACQFAVAIALSSSLDITKLMPSFSYICSLYSLYTFNSYFCLMPHIFKIHRLPLNEDISVSALHTNRLPGHTVFRSRYSYLWIRIWILLNKIAIYKIPSIIDRYYFKFAISKPGFSQLMNKCPRSDRHSAS